MNSKTLFQKDKELCGQLQAVVKADWFAKALAFAKAEMHDKGPFSSDVMLGAMMFEATLLRLPDNEDEHGEESLPPRLQDPTYLKPKIKPQEQ